MGFSIWPVHPAARACSRSPVRKGGRGDGQADQPGAAGYGVACEIHNFPMIFTEHDDLRKQPPSGVPALSRERGAPQPESIANSLSRISFLFAGSPLVC